MSNTAPTVPTSYRGIESGHVFRAIRAGDSCSIVGVSGMGKSDLFRHLCRLEVRQHYLGDAWRHYLVLALDSHRLGELSACAVFDMLLQLLAEEVHQGGVDGPVVKEIRVLAKEASATMTDPAHGRAFWHAAATVMTGVPARRLVVLFDEFDEVYIHGEPALLCRPARLAR